MEQYNELKSLIEKQAAEIADLKNINKQLVNVVQTTMVYDYIDENMPDWARKAVQAAAWIAEQYRVMNRADWGYPIRILRAICREYRCGIYDNSFEDKM